MPLLCPNRQKRGAPFAAASVSARLDQYGGDGLTGRRSAGNPGDRMERCDASGACRRLGLPANIGGLEEIAHVPPLRQIGVGPGTKPARLSAARTLRSEMLRLPENARGMVARRLPISKCRKAPDPTAIQRLRAYRVTARTGLKLTHRHLYPIPEDRSGRSTSQTRLSRGDICPAPDEQRPASRE